MQKILFKRALRGFKKNFLSYFALFLLLVFCMMIAIVNNATAEMIMSGTMKNSEEHLVEDGSMTTISPLSDSQIEMITSKGVTLEKQFYSNYEMKDKSRLRIFQNRSKINLPTLIDGKVAENDDEIMIERRYAEVHDIKIGDTINVSDIPLKVCGISVVPDYEAVLEEPSTAFTDANTFGLGFVTPKAYANIKLNGYSMSSETYVYSYGLNGKMTDDELKDITKTFLLSLSDIESMDIEDIDISSLDLDALQKVAIFMPKADNLRIDAAANDQEANKQTGIFALILVLLLVAYIISVFVSHEINEDSSIVGTLYALGIKRFDLVMHYLYVPLFISLLGGAIGCAFGFADFMIDMLAKSSYEYFSLPNLIPIYPIGLILFAVLMPPFITAIVNFFVILKKLNKPVLSLIRKENTIKKKNSKLKLNKLGFVEKFQLRQFTRETRSNVIVLCGLLIALLLVMLVMNCSVMCNNLVSGAKEDINFEYVYTYKFPTKEVPKDGSEAYGEVFVSGKYGYNFDVTLLGIKDDNPYFDIETPKIKDEVIVSSAMAQKFNIKVGDKLVLPNKAGTKDYTFNVIGIKTFSSSFYMFTNINLMREEFGKNDNYFNIVMSTKKLDIPSENLYTTTTKEDIIHSSQLIVDLMSPMIMVFSVASIIVFIMVMYIMLKTIIDKSKYNISLLGVFGYRPNEIRKLYIDGNFFTIVLGSIIVIPLAKLLMDLVYPLMCANLACAIDIALPWFYYLIVFVSIIALYLVVTLMLTHKLKKIKPSDTIKNRE